MEDILGRGQKNLDNFQVGKNFALGIWKKKKKWTSQQEDF